MADNKNIDPLVIEDTISEASPNKMPKINVRKITMSEDIQQKAAMILSRYHSKLLLDGKSKPDELLSMVVTDAIEYLYTHKLMPDLKKSEN